MIVSNHVKKGLWTARFFLAGIAFLFVTHLFSFEQKADRQLFFEPLAIKQSENFLVQTSVTTASETQKIFDDNLGSNRYINIGNDSSDLFLRSLQVSEKKSVKGIKCSEISTSTRKRDIVKSSETDVKVNVSKAVHALQSLQATINMEVAGGREPKIFTGIIYFDNGANKESTRDDKIYIKCDIPAASTFYISILGQNIIYYRPANKQCFRTTRLKVESLNPPPQVLSQFWGDYEANYQGDVKLNGKTFALMQISFTDTGNSAKVWIDKTLWLPVRFQIQHQSSTTTITLSNITLLPSIQEDKFKIPIPSDVSCREW